MQNFVGENRHQHYIGHARHAHDPQQHHQGSDRRRAVHESESLDHVFPRRRLRRNSRRGVHLHHHQSGNDRNVTDAIREKAPTLPQFRDQNTRHRRSNHPGTVEHGRIQRDGIHQVFLAHHVYEKGLASGDIECVHHAQQRRQHEYVPHLHSVCEGQGRQHERQHHRRDLRRDDHVLAVAAIRDNSAQGSKQKHWNLAGKSDRPQL